MNIKWERCITYPGEINAREAESDAIIGWIEPHEGGFSAHVRSWDNPSETARFPTEHAAMRALRGEYAVYKMMRKENRNA